MTNVRMELPGREYDITVGNGLLSKAGELLNLNRKIFILTDSGVPAQYAEAVKFQCKSATIYTVNEGEGAKSLSVLEKVLEAMLEFGMTRGDALISIGGGVVGDLGGFAASTYMRGIDFYNLPTTLLSQVDSSIGGKTAVNLGGVKNVVGAFYQPKAVIIDTDVLKTLPARQIASGMAEAIKMALTSDEKLFRLIEKEGLSEKNMEKIIVGALNIKKKVVEADEKESGLRKILNFGHTLGHGIEASEKDERLYHGECVALGMPPFASSEVAERLLPLLNKVGLPTKYDGPLEEAIAAAAHDKKATSDGISVIFVEKIGSFKIEKISYEEFRKLVLSYYG